MDEEHKTVVGQSRQVEIEITQRLWGTGRTIKQAFDHTVRYTVQYQVPSKETDVGTRTNNVSNSES